MAISTPMLVTFIVYIFGMVLIGFYCLAFDQKLR
ncbi:proline:sodium symporter PutP [Klebsiella pneumoniae]|uniref:Proline:sodium symporter PutP n=1 Tax=Klebsiella pneumoniae TaxID=573 RepID=A0A2X3EXA2_KLEPN|nr:proline:sodium symporter PutP [Klebsiella pneumoniae]